MAKVIKASGNEVEPYWPALFAKAIKGTNVEDLLSNIGSAPAGGAAAPVTTSAPAQAAAPKGKHIFSYLSILALQRRKRKKKKKLTLIWVVSSVMITEQSTKSTKAE